jgi:exodeoxyribonuclease V alpha subunit
MSIHKSQGSEFENVALIMPSKTNKELLSKELVYTGLTRAKDHLEIFSSTENFEKAIAYSVKRTSGINGRLTSL